MKYTLPFDSKDKDTFDKIKSGTKRIETRAGGPKYDMIVGGDILIFECEGDSFERTVKRVEKFKSVDEMLQVYSPNEINPSIKTSEELKSLYAKFPGYQERLESDGIIVFGLE